ncbi:MAG: hypothetical protein AAF724_20310 [Pseudomonadota bacterium]
MSIAIASSLARRMRQVGRSNSRRSPLVAASRKRIAPVERAFHQTVQYRSEPFAQSPPRFADALADLFPGIVGVRCCFLQSGACLARIFFRVSQRVGDGLLLDCVEKLAERISAH